MNALPISPSSPTPKTLKAVAQSSGLVLLLIPQASLSVYEVYSTDGELLYLSLTEQFDDPASWRNRPESEQDAMMTLALDEYYGTMTWDESVADSPLPA